MKSLLQQPETKSFEIVLAIRDTQGNPTNRKKRFASDDPTKICEFYERNSGKEKKKRRTSEATSDQDANKILTKMYAKQDKEEQTNND